MKYLLIACLLLSACGKNTNTDCLTKTEADSIVFVNDSVLGAKVDTVKELYDDIKQKVDSAKPWRDSMRHVNDSLSNRIDTYAKYLLRDRTKLESARKYLRIVNNNPSQQKFLRGWMNRALQ